MHCKLMLMYQKILINNLFIVKHHLSDAINATIKIKIYALNVQMD